MRAAVTGAGGYVGINLLQRLADDGHDVVAVDRVRSDVAGEAVVWRQADVLDRQGVRAAIEGSDVVFHLAGKITLAPHDEEAWTVNTNGVRIAAEAALDAGVRRFVHCSSVHSFDQYGCGGRIDESTERSVDPSIPVYDRSKWAGEQELHTVIANGLDAVICNPTGIYGPVDHGLSRGNAVLRQVARGRVGEDRPTAGVVAADAGGIAPAGVEGEALRRLAIRQALQALQHHRGRDDRGRNRTPSLIREQVREGTVGEEPFAFAVHERVDRVWRQRLVAERGHVVEQVGLGICHAEGHRSLL